MHCEYVYICDGLELEMLYGRQKQWPICDKKNKKCKPLQVLFIL